MGWSAMKRVSIPGPRGFRVLQSSHTGAEATPPPRLLSYWYEGVKTVRA